MCQDNNLLVDTYLVDIPYIIFDTSTSTFAVSATKSSGIYSYAICFSFLKPCSYWNSDTLHAIVKLPQNINTHVASIAVNFVSNEREHLFVVHLPVN